MLCPLGLGGGTCAVRSAGVGGWWCTTAVISVRLESAGVWLQGRGAPRPIDWGAFPAPDASRLRPLPRSVNADKWRTRYMLPRQEDQWGAQPRVGTIP